MFAESSWSDVAAYESIGLAADESLECNSLFQSAGVVNQSSSQHESGMDGGWGEVAASSETSLYEPLHCMPSLEDDAEAAVVDLLTMPPQRRKRGRPKKLAQVAAAPVDAVVAVIPERDAELSGDSITVAKAMLLAMLGPQGDAAALPLMVPASEKLEVSRMNSFATMSDFLIALQGCIVASSQEGEALDEDVSKLYDRYISNPGFHVMSVVSTADVLKMSRFVVEDKLSKLAAGLYFNELFSRLCVEASLSSMLQATSGLRVYVDYCTYDEVLLKGSLKAETVGSRNSQLGVTKDGTISDTAWLQMLQGSMSTTSVPLKILQSQQSLALLLRFGQVYVKVHISLSSPLQCLQRTTTSVMQQALLQVNGCSPYCKEYVMKTRCACTDQASSNLKAERCLSQLRGFQSLHTKCDIHSSARSHCKTFDALMGTHVHGILHVALALQDAAALSIFRACLRFEVGNRLLVLQGIVPASAKAFKVRALNLFLGADTTKAVTVRILLSLLPNGNWCKHSSVEVYVKTDPGSVDKKELAASLESGLVFAMLGKKPLPWAQHRWCSSHKAIEQIGLLLAVHGLLLPTFQRFSIAMCKPGRTLASGVPETLLLSSQSTPAARADVMVEELQVLSADAQDGVEVPAPAEASLDEAMGNVSAEEHALHRSAGLQWLRSSPFPSVVILRLTLEPLKNLMLRQFHDVTEEFELQQQCLVSQKLKEGQVGTGLRDFMATIAANCTHEVQFFEDIQRLFEEDGLWSLLPTESFNVHNRALAHRLLSRLGCLITELLQKPHQRWPMRMFTMLHHEEKVQDLLQASECCLDAWSLGMRNHLLTFGLQEFKEVLLTHCLTVSTNTSPIEAKHASLRRFLNMKVQTWSGQLEHCSSAFLCQSLRRKSRKQLGVGKRNGSVGKAVLSKV
eukprot:6485336-Amphidinium_carterae.3